MRVRLEIDFKHLLKDCEWASHNPFWFKLYKLISRALTLEFKDTSRSNISSFLSWARSQCHVIDTANYQEMMTWFTHSKNNQTITPLQKKTAMWEKHQNVSEIIQTSKQSEPLCMPASQHPLHCSVNLVKCQRLDQPQWKIKPPCTCCFNTLHYITSDAPLLLGDRFICEISIKIKPEWLMCIVWYVINECDVCVKYCRLLFINWRVVTMTYFFFYCKQC